jgi:hypothetical protein
MPFIVRAVYEKRLPENMTPGKITFLADNNTLSVMFSVLRIEPELICK